MAAVELCVDTDTLGSTDVIPRQRKTLGVGCILSHNDRC